MKGICLLSTVPMRSEPSHRSEMVNQMIFGEMFVSIGKTRNEDWFEIELTHDGYCGWVDRKQLTPLEPSVFEALMKQPKSFLIDPLNLCVQQSSQLSTFLVPGSVVPLEKASPTFQIDGDTYEFNGALANGKCSRSEMLSFAYSFLNTPYLWGGRTPLGIDCSGFTQIIYRLAGCFIPRDASQQATVGNVLGFIEESQPGDLAFFDNEEGSITHVGIILPKNQIIHASGKVRVDELDQYGIYDRPSRKHTHRLRMIREVF
ncbi:MAG: C40 family peptidase [Cryomorphaceae bacterium]|nr:C40 family peptidase [Cryomorphaceae bacterium]